MSQASLDSVPHNQKPSLEWKHLQVYKTDIHSALPRSRNRFYFKILSFWMSLAHHLSPKFAQGPSTLRHLEKFIFCFFYSSYHWVILSRYVLLARSYLVFHSYIIWAILLEKLLWLSEILSSLLFSNVSFKFFLLLTCTYKNCIIPSLVAEISPPVCIYYQLSLMACSNSYYNSHLLYNQWADVTQARKNNW